MKKWYSPAEDRKADDQHIRRLSTVGLLEIITPAVALTFGFHPFVVEPLPEVTVLQKITYPGVSLLDGVYTDRRVAADRFQDIPDGLTKTDQETTYLQRLADAQTKVEQDEEDEENIEADTLINFLKTKSAAEIEARVNNDVVDIPTAADAIARLSKLIAYMLK